MKGFKTDPIGAAMGALIIVGAVGLVATLPTVAQPPGGEGRGRGANSPAGTGGQRRGPDGPGGERKAAGPMLGQILRNLTLTEKQKSQAEALMENERAQMEKIHEQVRQIHQHTRTRLNALLTADQRRKLEAQEKEMLQNGPGGGREGGHEGRGRGHHGPPAGGRGPGGF